MIVLPDAVAISLPKATLKRINVIIAKANASPGYQRSTVGSLEFTYERDSGGTHYRLILWPVSTRRSAGVPLWASWNGPRALEQTLETATRMLVFL